MEPSKPTRRIFSQATQRRLTALEKYRILDTGAEQCYTDLVLIASRICEVPIAMISLLDGDRQWFKAQVGVDGKETPIEHAFCVHAIERDEVMMVEDAMLDERFVDNPLVTGAPFIRFYAGSPLRTQEGIGLGTLCVIDRKPRHLTQEQTETLEALGRQVMALMDYRLAARQLAEALTENRLMMRLLPMCANCKQMRDEEGRWAPVDQYLQSHGGIDITHGMCPDCMNKYLGEIGG